MPLPLALGRFNRRVTNPLLWPLLRFVPGYVRIVHRGRRTGRIHRTPVLVFARRGRLYVALTYGPSAQWVRNVLAAGGGWIERRDRTEAVVAPRVFCDATRTVVPPPIRLFLRLLRADCFLEVEPTGNAVPSPYESATLARWK